MELIKDIYFNTDKLVENTTVKISYTGKFYQTENDKVFIHYGYGKNWNNVNDLEMKKTDLGYQTELNLVGGDTLNFCFKNQDNEWDNNFGNNYIFNIEKSIVNNLGTTTVGLNYAKNNATFYGKTFGNTEENSSFSNIYWNSTETTGSENSSKPETFSGIIEDTVNGTPESIDTIIGARSINTIVDTPAPESQANGITNNLGNVGINNLETVTPITPITNSITGDTIPVSTIFNTGIGNTTPINTIDNTKFGNTIPTNNTGKGNPFASIFNNVKGNSNPINTLVNNIKKVTFSNNSTTGNTIGQTENTSQTTPGSLMVTSNGVHWTQKIKLTVRKFFSYVPKLISGNYKRNVADNTNTKTK